MKPDIKDAGARRRIYRLAALLLCLAAAGCTTTGSSTSARSGVTVFGDIDAGVSSVSR